MKRSVPLSQLLGFAFTSFIGTLLHFLYEWTDKAVWAALISGVNESTWEHMKLLFFPMFAFAIAQSFFFKDRKDFMCIKLRGVLLGIAMIPVLFYTYNGVFGRSPAWINISIFYIAAAAAYLYESSRLNEHRTACRSSKAAFYTLCIIAAIFVIFTFATPEIAIFRDPVTNTYGI